MTLAAVLAEIGYWVMVILGVGLLIFIHEAGHFLVAKACRVKVLAFSLGFGPVIAGFRRGDTHYRISAVPLGGYVKMSGEYEQEDGGYAPEDFPAKPLWQRALILVAGVVMNALLAWALFAVAFASGVRLDPARLGAVTPGKPAWRAGLRPGDLVVAADDHRIADFADLQQATLAGRPTRLEVQRGDATLRLTVEPQRDDRLGAPAIGVAPAFGNRFEAPPDSAAAKAGFADGDELLAVSGVPATRDRMDFDPRFLTAVQPAAGPLILTVRRGGTTVDVALEPSGTRPMIGIVPYRDTVAEVRPGGAAEAAGWRPGDRPASVDGHGTPALRGFTRALLLTAEGVEPAVTVRRGDGTATLRAPATREGRLELLDDLHFADDPVPTRVEVFEEGAGPSGRSPAAEAGIPPGAAVLSVNDVPATDFEDVARRVREAAAGTAPLRIRWSLDGAVTESAVVPFAAPVYPLESLPRKDDRPVVRITDAGDLVARATARCGAAFRQIVASLTGMFTGTVDRKNLGGVILIGQVARDSAEEGAGRFLWVLAMLSANLAILNLLPIPLLDGGQLALLGLEAVLGRKPSEGVVAATQWVGLALILGLMGLGLFNDLGRIFGG